MKREPHSIWVTDDDGDIYSHTIYAVDEPEAKQIADAIGATYNGKKLEEVCTNCGAVTEMGEDNWDDIVL
jgi:hypothetical protein